MTKLEKKLARQARATERALTGYALSAKTTTSRNSGFYKPTFVNRIKLNK